MRGVARLSAWMSSSSSCDSRGDVVGRASVVDRFHSWGLRWSSLAGFRVNEGVNVVICCLIGVISMQAASFWSVRWSQSIPLSSGP